MSVNRYVYPNANGNGNAQGNGNGNSNGGQPNHTNTNGNYAPNGGAGGYPYPGGYASAYRSSTTPYPAAGADTWTPGLAMSYMSNAPPRNGANLHAPPFTVGGGAGPTYNDIDREEMESLGVGGHWPGTNGSHAGLHGRHGYGGYLPGTTPQGGGYMPERAGDIGRYNAAAGQYGVNGVYGDPREGHVEPRRGVVTMPPWYGNASGYGRGGGGP